MRRALLASSKEVAMRRGLPRPGWSAWPVLGALGVAVFLAARPAAGQIPEPRISDLTERSGLYTHFTSIEPNLPPDRRRDIFYDTRWDDNPRIKHQNWIKGGGLYGLPWKADCTQSVYPYFYGAPGQSTIDPGCRRWWRPLRYIQAFARPFRPVGMYYDQGSYVPLIDLDPIVPGPGPYPIPWYYRGWAAGGG
ncbi:MAG: hypothetical protein JOZ53_07340 [Planctomycetaceae bacterium]|nr:hypothetical protein [Planctomycetaceae bacterium]